MSNIYFFKKLLCLPLVIVLSFCSNQIVNAQAASATWALTTSAAAGVTGAITASPLTFSDLEIRDYAGPNGPLGSPSMRINPGPSTAWPFTVYSPTTYCEFKVTASATHTFTVSNIVLPMAGHNTGALRIEVYYSTNNFITSTQLNTGGQIFLNNGTYPSPATTYNPNVTINPGSSFTLRVYGYLSSQSTNFARYFLMQNVVISGATITPLSLLDFTAKKKTEGIQLNWRTTNEINTSSFNIERSNDGRNFNTVGSIASNNKVGINNYAFTDNNGNDKTYYKLKMIDRDGAFKYSNTILVKGNVIEVKSFPNPATNSITISHNVVKEKTVIHIIDMQGRLVQVVQVKNGTTQTFADIYKLKVGSYNVQFISGSHTQSIQIQKN